MRKSFWGGLSFILCAVFVVSLTAPAYVGAEEFVVSSSLNGDANYLSITDVTPSSSQQILQLTSNTGINVPYKFSYGNGLGDFDNDGDLDYIMAIGYGSGNIYISEKTADGNEFAEPYYVDTWGTAAGYFAMDFAVADYNEDGNADFILSLGYTASSGLYLGDGKFGFESKLLPNTAASSSAGADAADFNNDGHADFVIAPASDEPFFVSLGNGKGNFFKTTRFNSHEGAAVWGVAAADFTGDGNADIVAAGYDYLYVYEGAGDGSTFTFLAKHEFPLNFYPSLDNIDFDGDGNQDLVVASYDADIASIAVLLGNGKGGFEHTVTYLGGSGEERNAVSAHPWEPVKNLAPVAVIEPAYLEVTVGEEIVFDGSLSFDEDGQIVSYEWDFGDANPSADVGVLSLMSMAAAGPKATGANPSYTYQDSGTYIVTLWVTDDKGAKSSVQAEVHAEQPLIKVKAEVKLSLRRHYVLAKIQFSEEYDARNVDPASVYIVSENGTAIFSRENTKSSFLDQLFHKFNKHRKSIAFKFDREAVLATLACPPAKETTLTVGGVILQNEKREDFVGTGEIRLKRKKGSSCGAD